MLDIGRVVVLLVALVQAIRHRFVVGIVFGVVLATAFAAIGVASSAALTSHTVSGEYGFAFVYIGPTALPYGERDWFSVVVQAASPRSQRCRRGGHSVPRRVPSPRRSSASSSPARCSPC